MITSYKFSNFCGCVHKNGNILFSSKLNQLFSAVGNKVTVFDLEHNVSTTLPCEARNDIALMALSPDSKILICIDRDGYSVTINLLARVVINHFNFKEQVNDVKYSPDGKFLAICAGRNIKIYEAPDLFKSIEPMVLFKKYHGAHNDNIKQINWSQDSRLILSCSKDNTVRIFTVFLVKNYTPICLTGHKSSIVYATSDSKFNYVYTLAKDGMFLFWKWVDDYVSETYKKIQQYEKFKAGKKIKVGKNEGIKKEGEDEEEVDEDQGDMRFASETEKRLTKGRLILEKKQLFQQSGSKISSASYHHPTNLFIVGFRNGVFGLYKLTEAQLESLQTFSVSEAKITSLCFNFTGSWIGLSCASLGQLIVWEWRSQTYVLNQQGLFYEVHTLDFSPNGNVLATGGFDGKVKLWDTKTYLCFATFKDHASKVTGVKFVQQNANTLVSSSLDGTVRAYDTKRYRNFRIMRPDINVQLNCLAVDHVGDIVCAGSIDPYIVYCWSIQTGNLVDKVVGHEGPISHLQFSPLGNLLASSSWDKTVRISDLYSKDQKKDIFDHNSEVTVVAFRPDGKELCTSTLKGELYLWDVEAGQTRGLIDCRKDILGGRGEHDLRTAKNSTSNKHFNTIAYSSDGDYLLAGGNSKYVCLYYLRQRVLLKRYILTNNRALDAMFDKLSTKNIKGGVNMNQIDTDSGSDIEERKDLVIPGSKRPENMKRNVKQKIECRRISFSPSGESWVAATTEGVHVYSYTDATIFAPLELDEEVSIDSIKSAFSEGRYYSALVNALKLNENKVLQIVYENIPAKDINTICQSMSTTYLERFLNFLSLMVVELPSIELNLKWIEAVLFYHSAYLKKTNMITLSIFRNILKSLHQRSDYLINLCQDNIYTLEYLKEHIQHHADTPMTDVTNGMEEDV